MSFAVHSLAERIHAQALELSGRYKRAEADLIEILQQVDEHRVHILRKHPSLFSYATRDLGLSDNVSYNLITVARKAREIPALKEGLRSGELTLSNARRIVAVLTPENQTEWLQKASSLSNRQLEKEIVKVRPQEAVRERTSYVTPTRVKLETGLSERAMFKVRRAQDLLSQSRRRAVSLEETIETLTDEFLNRRDPVTKAKRHQVRKGSPSSTVDPLVTRRVRNPDLKRAPIPAAILHQVNLRDERRCTHPLPDGTRCNQSRWTEVHHRIHVCHGGESTLENLTTLCSSHHKLMHLAGAGVHRPISCGRSGPSAPRCPGSWIP